MTTNTLHTDNPELLHYLTSKLRITILGGIKLTGLDRLKVTLKIVAKENVKKVFKNNLDLNISIQTGQLTERAEDFLDVHTANINEAINQLTWHWKHIGENTWNHSNPKVYFRA